MAAPEVLRNKGNQWKALCYPNQPRNVSLDTLVRLAQADGKQVLKGANVKVLDRVWSEVCEFWVVIVGVNSPTVFNASVVEEGKTKA